MLPSFEIINFRVFKRLALQRLGRVNLIMGKNGVGKSTFLEALRLYGMGNSVAIREYLTEQQEWAPYSTSGVPVLDLRSLFHDRTPHQGDISLGPIEDDAQRLRITAARVVCLESKHGDRRYYRPEEVGVRPDAASALHVGAQIERAGVSELVALDPIHRADARGRYAGPPLLSPGEALEAEVTWWWDELSLTAAEARIVEFLSLLAPVDAIATVEDPARADAKARMFKVRLHAQQSPVPLRSLGGGVVRAFQIAVALEYSELASQQRGASLPEKQGQGSRQERLRLLLIDEIENGIHYSVHPKLWAALFHLAETHHLQVFATTHSWDCLKGFAEAVKGDEQADGLAIRLERVEGSEQTGAVIIDRDDLPIVLRDSIEVR